MCDRTRRLIVVYEAAEDSDMHDVDTLLHEGLHAAAYEWADEEWVARTARDLARLLVRQGYRRAGS